MQAQAEQHRQTLPSWNSAGFRTGGQIPPCVLTHHDCIFVVTTEDFLKIMSAEMNPVWAFTTGTLKVQGDIEKAL